MSSGKQWPFCLGLYVLKLYTVAQQCWKHPAARMNYKKKQKKSCLTHWDRDKMDAISRKTFSNVFSSMKMFEFRTEICSQGSN